ncbi:hypothetical protein POTOM_053792 [Populus tomentosa]|uniref:Band 7 domain-containing protein n=3 Tax=Populus TaxID=3689 RepID=A0A8X8BZL9_POPTO|nr:hypothetical protein POTOM_053792 [Populus tomentosa]
MNSSPRTIICLPTEGGRCHNHDKWMEEGEDLLEEPGQLFSSRRAHSFKHRVPSWLLFDEGPISAESMDSRANMTWIDNYEGSGIYPLPLTFVYWRGKGTISHKNSSLVKAIPVGVNYRIQKSHTEMGNLLGCVKVDQSTVVIKESFGKFNEVLQPGCHCMPWYLGSQVAGHLTLRLQQLDVRCETKTKDNVFVNVVASVQYRALADKASDAFYKLTNTRSQIQAYVFDVIRASVPKLLLDDVFEQKNEIARAVEEELEKAMSAYGYEIVQTLIVDIEPDEHVKRAMNEINAAARMRLAANEKAEAEKIIQIKRAEGEAESKYLAGLGIARQRQAIVDGLRDSVLGFSDNVPGTSAKDVLDMVLITQYFDTMKEIGAASKSSAVFIPHGPGAVRDIATQIRDGLLQASAPQYTRAALVNSVVLNMFVNCVQFSSIWFTLLVMIWTLQIRTCSWLRAARSSKMLHGRRCSAKDQGQEIHLVNGWLTTYHTRRSTTYQWLGN